VRIPMIMSILLLAGCTTMPSSYTRGDKALWPRWGHRVTNVTPESIDLEIIFQQYAFACTAADGQVEHARALFQAQAANEAKTRGREFVPVPDVELSGTHNRNEWDGVCSVRVGHRLVFKPAVADSVTP
jgi:hypothetical protein